MHLASWKAHWVIPVFLTPPQSTDNLVMVHVQSWDHSLFADRWPISTIWSWQDYFLKNGVKSQTNSWFRDSRKVPNQWPWEKERELGGNDKTQKASSHLGRKKGHLGFSGAFLCFLIGLWESENYPLENSHLRSTVFFFLHFVKSLKAFSLTHLLQFPLVFSLSFSPFVSLSSLQYNSNIFLAIL